MKRHGWVFAIAIAGVACGPKQFDHQAYLPAWHNWAFRNRYGSVDRLFNAFDYGHSRQAELLVADPANAAARLNGPEFEYITTRLLGAPPRLPLEMRALAPTFTRETPEIDVVFEWAHLLHRQLYDALADNAGEQARDVAVEHLLEYYASREDLALARAPKSMELMEGQAFSTSFRRAAPRFNGLIWSYHWLQLALYDALLEPSGATRGAAVRDVTTRFRAMTTGNLPLPTVMPMAAAVAPRFTARYPEAAIIFDNLHSLHDVVADVLVTAPAAERRARLLHALEQYQDTAHVTTRDEWIEMSHGMGVGQMGGVAIPTRRTP